VENKHLQSAQNLVAAAEVFAANSRGAFVQHYPSFGQIIPDDWRLLVTVAGTGTALLSAAELFAGDDQRQLTETILQSLLTWNKSSVAELQDFLGFVTGTVTSSEGLPDAIGTWIVRSIDSMDPGSAATQVLGMALIKTFQNWWD
jgi:hypothetical protein